MTQLIELRDRLADEADLEFNCSSSHCHGCCARVTEPFFKKGFDAAVSEMERRNARLVHSMDKAIEYLESCGYSSSRPSDDEMDPEDFMLRDLKKTLAAYRKESE